MESNLIDEELYNFLKEVSKVCKSFKRGNRATRESSSKYD